MDRENRRVSRRYSVSIPCKFNDPDKQYQGRLKNLSIDGAFVEADECPAVGALGNLSFQSGKRQQLKIAVRVVHKSRLSARSDEIEGFGLYFVDLHDESLARLEELLRKLAASQGSET